MLFEIPDAQQPRAELRDDRCERRACHAQAEHAHRQQIEDNIDGRGRSQEPHRRFAVAQRTQDARTHIIKDRRGDADENNEDIVERVVHLLLRRSHEAQQPARTRKRHGQQHRRHNKSQPDTARHIAAQLPVLARAERLRQRNGHAGTQTAAKAEHKEVDRPCRPDAAQRHYAQRMADDRRIDQRIYLLQKKPEQHRNGKLPDPRNRLSNCQILCHSCAPPVCCGYPLYHIFSNCQFNFVRIRLIYVIIFVHNGHKLCCRAAVRSRQSFFMLSLQFVLIFFSVISDSCSMLKAQKQKTHTHRKDARKGDFQYV